jgi:hypothetical protein
LESNCGILFIEREVQKMDKEKIITRIMKECEADGEPVTREEDGADERR